MSEDKEQFIIRAAFGTVTPEFVARIKAIAEASDLPTDPKVIADDVQNVAGLALLNKENIDMLIQLIGQIAKTGTLKVELPQDDPPKHGRFG